MGRKVGVGVHPGGFGELTIDDGVISTAEDNAPLQLAPNGTGAVQITNNIASSSTSTGALQVTGGIGAGGTIYATGFNGPLTGTVTGNVSGNLTGNVTGDIASTGTSTFSGTTTVTGTFTYGGQTVLTATERPALGTNGIIRTNTQTINEDITIPAGTSGMSSGPITIASGRTITVNGDWSIV